MKAIVQNAYGSSAALSVKEVAEPIVKENYVLIKVYAAAVNAGDYFSMKGSPWLARLSVGFPRPKDFILGWDVAGRVEAVGKNVKKFKPGDAVFAVCKGAFAEYACVSEDNVATKPTNLSFEQTAAVPTAGMTALQGLRDMGKIQTGQKVLINGAAGGVGTFAVQIAKSFGTEVTGVCSTTKVDMVRSIGADHVIDYTKEDFTKSDQRYDLILDNVGNHSLADLRRMLKPKGMIIPNSGHGGMSYVFKSLILSLFMRQHGSLWVCKSNARDLLILKEFIESGKITPVIDRIYPFDETPQAIEYVGHGHARGKVIINVVEEK